jgi:hypothetical protein
MPAPDDLTPRERAVLVACQRLDLSGKYPSQEALKAAGIPDSTMATPVRDRLIAAGLLVLTTKRRQVGAPPVYPDGDPAAEADLSRFDAAVLAAVRQLDAAGAYPSAQAMASVLPNRSNASLLDARERIVRLGFHAIATPRSNRGLRCGATLGKRSAENPRATGERRRVPAPEPIPPPEPDRPFAADHRRIAAVMAWARRVNTLGSLPPREPEPPPPPRGSTPYRGVVLTRGRAKPYTASVHRPGQARLCLGSFATALEAARAYDEAVRRVKGPGAPTNFPGGLP